MEVDRADGKEEIYARKLRGPMLPTFEHGADHAMSVMRQCARFRDA